MTRTVIAPALAAVVVALTTEAAHAQISEARLQELVRQAAEATGERTPLSASPQTPAAAPAPTVSLTLDDAVRFALERNLDIAVQRLNPEIQDINIAGANAFYHPTLTSAVVQSSQVQTPSTQLQLSDGGRGVTNDQLVYNAGITQNLRFFGSSISATFNNNRFESDSNNALFNPRFDANWSLVFTQPMLRGFKIDAQRRSLEVTQINRDISDVQLRASLTNTVSNVRNAYWDYVFTNESVEVARQSLELATKLVQDNQIRVEVGTMAPIDVVQAQAEQATRRQALVTAENLKRTAELSLKRLIVSGTEDPNWNATLDAVDRAEFQPEPVNVEDAIRKALSARTDVSIARKTVEANSITLSYLRNQTLPEVGLQVTYGLQGIGGNQLIRSNEFGGTTTTVLPGSINDTFASLFDRRYPRWNVALNMSYPLGASTQDAAVARARVQLSQVQAQIKQIELQVATEVTNAAISVRNSSEAVQAAQAARDLSQRRLEAEQSKFEVGMSTNYFVVQAQRDLNDARNSELRNVLNYRKAIVEFERLQETTLQNANVTVIPAGGQ